MMSSSQQALLQPHQTVRRQDILKILELSMTAPSGDNTQPWEFKITPAGVTVYHIRKRGEHALNNQHHATYLALGTLIEAASIAATKMGVQVELNELMPFEGEGDIAHLTFTRAGVECDILEEALTKRCTDRRPFVRESFPDSIEQELFKLATPFSDVGLSLQTTPSSELKEFLTVSDSFMWVNPEVLRDLFKWVRLSEHEINSTNDGMAWQNLGLQAFEVPMFRWMRTRPEFPKKFWNFGFKQKVQSLSLRGIENASAFALIAVDGRSLNKNYFLTIVNAGRLAMRVWLALTARGFGAQPLSLASMTAFDYAMNKAPSYAAEEFHRHYTEGIELLKSEFSLKPGWLPLWMLRTGRPQDAREVFRTKRLPIASLIRE